METKVCVLGVVGAKSPYPTVLTVMHLCGIQAVSRVQRRVDDVVITIQPWAEGCDNLIYARNKHQK